MFATFVMSGRVAVAQPIPTEIPGVTAEVLELRSAGGILRLAIRVVNTTASPTTPAEIRFSEVALLDMNLMTKTFGLTDPAQRYLAGPATDWEQGGRWQTTLPPKKDAILWMYFPAAAPGAVVTVQVPRMRPFENVKVTQGQGTVTSAQSAGSTPAGFTATLIYAQRQGQDLRVQVRLDAAPGATASVPDPEILAGDIFVFDPAAKRKYTMSKDPDGTFLAQPLTDKSQGGRLLLDTLSAPRVLTLMFLAPPPSVSTVDLIIPRFLPFEAVTLEDVAPAKRDRR
jgi:hypothetical protein